jgi:quercetin dioxygenase-like cupin family protein
MDYKRLEDMPQVEPAPGFRVRFVHGATMTLAYWDIARGASLPQHAHIHEQVVSMIEGEFELTVAGEARTLSAGTVVVIPSNVPHAGRALTDCRIIDAFHPVREDYRKG